MRAKCRNIIILRYLLFAAIVIHSTKAAKFDIFFYFTLEIIQSQKTPAFFLLFAIKVTMIRCILKIYHFTSFMAYSWQ